MCMFLKTPPLMHHLAVFIQKSFLLCAVGRVSTGQSLGLAFLVAQTVKNLPATQETWVHSLGQEDDLQKGMAIHSCILAWRIP